MTLTDLAMLLLFLAVFVFVSLLFIQGGRRRPANPELQECPECGAQNHKGKERCYCCSHQLVSPQPDEPNLEVIHRVKEAEDGRGRRSVHAPTLEAVEDEPSQGESR